MDRSRGSVSLHHRIPATPSALRHWSAELRWDRGEEQRAVLEALRSEVDAGLRKNNRKGKQRSMLRVS